MSELTEKDIKVTIQYGRVDLRTWTEYRDGKFVGMGSVARYDKDGNLESFKIEPTGLVLTYG